MLAPALDLSLARPPLVDRIDDRRLMGHGWDRRGGEAASPRCRICPCHCDSHGALRRWGRAGVGRTRGIRRCNGRVLRAMSARSSLLKPGPTAWARSAEGPSRVVGASRVGEAGGQHGAAPGPGRQGRGAGSRLGRLAGQPFSVLHRAPQDTGAMKTRTRTPLETARSGCPGRLGRSFKLRLAARARGCASRTSRHASTGRDSDAVSSLDL